MKDYANTVIYKIHNPNVRGVYIGHTTNMSMRRHAHKAAALAGKDNLRIYATIRSTGGFGAWRIDVIEEYPECKNLYEARLREQQHIARECSLLNSATACAIRTREDVAAFRADNAAMMEAFLAAQAAALAAFTEQNAEMMRGFEQAHAHLQPAAATVIMDSLPAFGAEDARLETYARRKDIYALFEGGILSQSSEAIALLDGRRGGFELLSPLFGLYVAFKTLETAGLSDAQVGALALPGAQADVSKALYLTPIRELVLSEPVARVWAVKCANYKNEVRGCTDEYKNIGSILRFAFKHLGLKCKLNESNPKKKKDRVINIIPLVKIDGPVAQVAPPSDLEWAPPPATFDAKRAIRTIDTRPRDAITHQ